jgi:hypothetical protein
MPISSAIAQTDDLAQAREFYLRDIARLKDCRAGRVAQYPYVPPRLQPNQTLVLVDLQGAGYLTHVWATAKWNDEWISFYFDGETKPSIEGKWTDIFAPSNSTTGTISRLPIALEKLPTGACAFNCYIPMPFKKSVKVTLTNRAATEIADTYFIFDYLLRPENEVPDCHLRYAPESKTFSYAGPDADEQFDPLRNRSAELATDFDEYGGGGGGANRFLAPGKEEQVFDISGAGVVDSLTLECKTPSAAKVRIFYDDSKDAAIDCRLDKLFGKIDCMVLQRKGDRYTFHLPMPFRQRWRMTIENVSNKWISLDSTVGYCQLPSQADDFAYLHAAWNAADGKNGSTYPLFSASGKGHFVGMLLYQPTTTVWPSDHAGADFIYGDAASPNPFAMRAIGGEDYFCAAYFGDDYATPLVGATKDYMHGGMRYRFHLENPIPFAKSINVDFGIFQGNSYESVAFWYQDAPGKSAPALAIPWQCLGPFDPNAVPDDVVASILDPGKLPDFDKVYPVSVKSYFGTPFERQARWRSQIAKGGFVDSTAEDTIPVNGPYGSSWVLESVGYAMTELTLKAPQELTLRVGHGNPVEVFIDGKSVASFGAKSAFEADLFTASLAAGKHRIVVKSRNALHPACLLWDAFSLAIEDAQGAILPASDFSEVRDPR